MLMSIDNFEILFEHLHGKKIGVVLQPGNVGDTLHKQGMLQLFQHHDINYYIESLDNINNIPADELVYSGGGTLGAIWNPITPVITTNYALKTEVGIKRAYVLRCRCQQTGRPWTIFPQSFQAKERIQCHKLFVRECFSLEYHQQAILSPDTSLAYTLPTGTQLPAPTVEHGVFLKTDCAEGIITCKANIKDPIQNIVDEIQYVKLAAQYKTLYTDRCHFAIASLIASAYDGKTRNVFLLANSYHKNYGLWISWLKDLGVQWLSREGLQDIFA